MAAHRLSCTQLGGRQHGKEGKSSRGSPLCCLGKLSFRVGRMTDESRGCGAARTTSILYAALPYVLCSPFQSLLSSRLLLLLISLSNSPQKCPPIPAIQMPRDRQTHLLRPSKRSQRRRKRPCHHKRRSIRSGRGSPCRSSVKPQSFSLSYPPQPILRSTLRNPHKPTETTSSYPKISKERCKNVGRESRNL